MAPVVIFLTFVLEMPSSNLGRDIEASFSRRVRTSLLVSLTTLHRYIIYTSLDFRMNVKDGFEIVEKDLF
jgi:hypothetical protein